MERAEQVALPRAVARDQAQGNDLAAPMEPGRQMEYPLQRGQAALHFGVEPREQAETKALLAD